MLISFDLRISYCCNRISDTYTSWLQNVEQVLQVYLEIMEYDTDHINTYSHTYYIYIFNIWYNLIGSTLAKSGCFASILVIAFFLCWSRCAASSNGEDDEDRGDMGVALDSLGTVGTLAAGFVMYNITTFNTEPGRSFNGFGWFLEPHLTWKCQDLTVSILFVAVVVRMYVYYIYNYIYLSI